MFPIKLIRHKNPEIFFALAAPIGADLDKVCEHLAGALDRFDYRLEVIKVISLLKQVGSPPYLRNEPTDEYKRIKGRMDAGDKFRDAVNRDDALAILAVSTIRTFRKKYPSSTPKRSSENTPVPRQSYVFRSLKRPEEITALRRIYGSNLIVIGVHSAREQRVHNLSERIKKSQYQTQAEQFRDKAEELVLRDEADETKPHGQRLRDAFAMADVFLDASNTQALGEDIARFLNLLFGKPVVSPTKAEVAMAQAHISALRSSEMGRQVGAAIVDLLGNVVAVGTNEVPRAGGGSYWERESPDYRDWQNGVDSSDQFKRTSLGELLHVLSDKKKFIRSFSKLNTDKQIEQVVPLLKQTRYMQLIEFIRAVHAEMSALIDAAMRGASVRGCEMYVTTFPCHECARHLIAAGISKVFYIEPYAKSLAVELHEDALQLDSTTEPNRVPFLPFLGVAPRAYPHIFAMPDRKKTDGTVIDWDERTANPRVSGSFWSYIEYEKEDLEFLTGELEEKGLKMDRHGRKREGKRRIKERIAISSQRSKRVAGLAAKRRSIRS
jgi:deoxycytidylate deaminase